MSNSCGLVRMFNIYYWLILLTISMLRRLLLSCDNLGLHSVMVGGRAKIRVLPLL